MGREREDRKRTSAAGDRRRATVSLAQLGWLQGFPADGGWRCIADDAVLPLDGAAVAKARRTARTVMREHPVGLASMVGDVARWWAIVDAKLAWMSDAVAGRAGALDLSPLLPGRLAATVRGLAARPIGPAVRAATIAFAERPDALADLVGWLAAHADLADLADPRLALALARLAVLGDRGKGRASRERGALALLRLCALDAPDGGAALQASRTVENQLRAQPTKERVIDPVRSAAHAIPWVLRLATREPAHQQRVLALVAEIGLAEALQPWQAWEREHAVVLERAVALTHAKFAWPMERDKAVASALVKIERSRALAPTAVPLAEVLVELDLLGEDPRHQPAILRLLAALPEAWGPADRARLLLHVARTAATANSEEHPEWVWDALAEALDAGAPPAVLAPWHAVITAEYRRYLESGVLHHAKRKGDVQRVMRTLVALARTTTPSERNTEHVALWLAAGLAESLVPEVVAAIRDGDGWLTVELARAIVAIAEPTPADVAALTAMLLAKVTDWQHATTHALGLLVEHAAATGGAWLIRAALDDGQAEALATLGEMLALQPRARWPRLATAAAAPWIAAYPAALHPALRRLASVDPDAEHTAAKRLADDLPDPAALRAEIAALRTRLDRPGTAKRLANLEARLAHPKMPSEKRLANLTVKVERTARELGLARFAREITDAASGRVLRACGLAELPAWARPPRTLSLLFAALSLEERDRTLAARLIRARSGPRPWDLRDEPANRAYLAEVARAGLDPAPWLDDTPRRYDNLTLELTGDPIEVFAMGAHFGTCLSPTGSNFFSVIANAADVNKRVIYAKRDDRVIGRCLLALTDAFQILVFDIYCHEAAGIEGQVRGFVLDLATRMRTTMAPRGHVRLLLARDWYDDGPRDLVGRFRGLDETPLDFAAIEPANLVGMLRAALGHELDDVTLPVVLGHRGVIDRPELVIPLAPYILAATAPLTHVIAAELALRAGDRGLADRLLGDHAGVIRLDDHPWRYGETLAELRPAYTLARLRETRDKGARSWEDERGDRCAVAAVALEALHRPKQARTMYELALRDDWLEPHLRARLDRLLRRLR